MQLVYMFYGVSTCIRASRANAGPPVVSGANAPLFVCPPISEGRGVYPFAQSNTPEGRGPARNLDVDFLDFTFPGCTSSL